MCGSGLSCSPALLTVYRLIFHHEFARTISNDSGYEYFVDGFLLDAVGAVPAALLRTVQAFALEEEVVFIAAQFFLFANFTRRRWRRRRLCRIFTFGTKVIKQFTSIAEGC